MYKIFINNHPLCICDANEKIVEVNRTLCIHDDSLNILRTTIELAHCEPEFFDQVFFITKDPKALFKALKHDLKYIKAAGGLVKNNEGKTLFIYRNGKWDLPKGKLEEGETPEIAAIREVEEECGISRLKITKEIPSTYHTYIMNDKLILKRTYWYAMTCADNSTLIPQTEEGITDVKWLNNAEVDLAMQNTYLSIRECVGNSL